MHASVRFRLSARTLEVLAAILVALATPAVAPCGLIGLIEKDYGGIAATDLPTAPPGACPGTFTDLSLVVIY